MKYQVCEPLSESEFADLKASIAEHGIMVPIEVDEQGNILDGHHRVRAWQELRAEGVNIPEYARLIRGGLSEEAKFDHALRLNDIRRHMSKEARERTRQRALEQRERARQQVIELRQQGKSIRQIVEETGLGIGTVHRTLSDPGVPPELFGTPVVNGADGKTYPAQQQPKPAPPATFFVPGASVAGGKPFVTQNSGNNEWYTPAAFIAAARAVMGAIDLDPASTEMANEVVGAATYYDVQDDGLLQHWHGRVWMNPPYASDLVGRFVEKLIFHHSQAHVPEAMVLVNNATETQWFQRLAAHAGMICFPVRRVRFWAPDGESAAPLQGQAVLYLGSRHAAFGAVFAPFGFVVAALP